MNAGDGFPVPQEAKRLPYIKKAPAFFIAAEFTSHNFRSYLWGGSIKRALPYLKRRDRDIYRQIYDIIFPSVRTIMT